MNDFNSAIKVIHGPKGDPGDPGNYTAGAGISITPATSGAATIAAKVDGTTITTNENGQLVALGEGGAYSAGYGLDLDDTTLAFSINPAQTQKKLTAGTNITIDSATDTISAVDTTYTAGSNIQINNNVISATDTTYSGGTAIDVVNNSISVKYDGTTIGVNSSGQLEALGGGGGTDVTKLPFTTANVEAYYQTGEYGYDNGVFVQTKGNSVQDSLTWENGTAVISFSHIAEMNPRYSFQIVVQDPDDLREYNTDSTTENWGADEGSLPEGVTYTQLIIGVDEGVFKQRFKRSDGEYSEYVTFPDTAGKVVHFQGFMRGCNNPTVVSATGYMVDYVWSLPHDLRLDSAFDEPGFVHVGSKKIALLDLQNSNMHSLTQDDISFVYDAEEEMTYVYDFYRKDYSMLYEGETSTVKFTVELNYDHDLCEFDLGLYNCFYADPFTPISLGSYDENATGAEKAAALRFEAVWDDTYHGFTCKWMVVNIDNEIVYTTPTTPGTSTGVTGPCGIYIGSPGRLAYLGDRFYGLGEGAQGIYSKFVTSHNTEYEDAWTDRDLAVTPANTGGGVINEGYDITSGTADNNYLFTNGTVRFACGDVEHAAGTWTLEVVDQYGGTIGEAATYDETAAGGSLVSELYLARDVVGVTGAMWLSGSEDPVVLPTISMSRDTFCRLKLTYAGDTEIEGLYSLFSYYDISGRYEKINDVTIATTTEYGSIKYNGDDFTTNSDGQLSLSGSVQTKLTKADTALQPPDTAYDVDLLGYNTSNQTWEATTHIPYVNGVAPGSANNRGLQIIVLNSEPTTKYSGYLYIITES